MRFVTHSCAASSCVRPSWPGQLGLLPSSVPSCLSLSSEVLSAPRSPCRGRSFILYIGTQGSRRGARRM